MGIRSSRSSPLTHRHARRYPFVSVGSNFCVHCSCDLRRSIVPHIKIGNSVFVAGPWRVDQHSSCPNGSEPVILFDEGCKVGRRCVISARNRIHFEQNVIFAPSVLVMDHNHAFEDVNVPIKRQGITPGRNDPNRGRVLDWFRSSHCLR
jgi:acetyltransferase-like isoleucine patch superfamily enzyme